jgi:hypothetical protein
MGAGDSESWLSRTQKGFYGLVSDSPLFEIARVLVRFDHVASRIVNANHGIHVTGRKTQASKQTSGRERLSRPDLCVATKCHILINHQAGRFDVTMQRATRLELAAFSHENIALHRPLHLHRFCPDLTAYARVLPDRERSGGIDCALHLAVDEQLVQEFDRAFD